ncbi:MAG: superoxide dismutase family protein [Oligoflexus sp.]|nr:superoxide dismutase family protein [Oligoflexus sp.]
MKIYSSLLIAVALTSTLGLAQTDPGVTAGRITPTTPTSPAASTAEQTAPKDDAAVKTPAAAAALKKGAKFATAKLAPKSGSKAAGTVTFTNEGNGIKVVANVTGVEPGKHGFHIHEKGDCSAEDAATAGGHFNPGSAAHGAPGTTVRHAGDFGNIDIKKDGTGVLKISVKDPKDFTAWADIAGKAVIIHEKADDLKTQPTGDAGKRIACGVIELTPNTSH